MAAAGAAVPVNGGIMHPNNPNILAQCHFCTGPQGMSKLTFTRWRGQQQENSDGRRQRAACGERIGRWTAAATERERAAAAEVGDNLFAIIVMLITAAPTAKSSVYLDIRYGKVQFSLLGKNSLRLECNA